MNPFPMREHPIPQVTEPLQYRAIGLVRGVYKPDDPDKFTRGHLVDSDEVVVEAVVLGRVMTLMRKHLEMEKPHLWVVYPRSRKSNCLHLQIAGIWEPSTLGKVSNNESEEAHSGTSLMSDKDRIPEGDDYFSIRGELIFTKPETDELVVKVRQQPRADGSRPLPFKIKLKGNVPFEHLRKFVCLDVRRTGQELLMEKIKIIGSIPTHGGKGRKGKF